MNSCRVLVLVALAGLAATVADAGPLNPPAGPVGSTMKTLAEVEPRIAVNAANTPGNASATYVISQNGSYYLTGDLAGEAGKAVILVNCSQVTLDLSGFQIVGGTNGVRLGGIPRMSIMIRNGFVYGCSGSGVHTVDDGWARGTIEDVTVDYCSGKGFELGYGLVGRRLRATHNDLGGISMYDQGVLEDSQAMDNGGDGIWVGQYSKLNNCVAHGDNGNGVVAGAKSTLRACRADECGLTGFQVSEATLDRCESYYNNHLGFEIGAYSTVTGCEARQNFMQGLHGTDRNTIVSSQFRSQTAANNGYAGLWLEGSYNRVEDCEASGNGYGFYISPPSVQNIVVRCRASSNPTGNYFIPAGNQAAPIVTNPGSGGYSTMTAWSNIAY